MAKFNGIRKVKQFADEEIICTQEVHLETEDLEGWMVVCHDGNEISISVENWKSLVELADAVLKQAGV